MVEFGRSVFRTGRRRSSDREVGTASFSVDRACMQQENTLIACTIHRYADVYLTHGVVVCLAISVKCDNASNPDDCWSNIMQIVL